MANVSGLGSAWGNRRILYLAWSVIPEFGGVKDIVFSWFFFQRVSSNIDPASAVKDFEAQGDLRKQLLRRRIMEFFEWDEVMLLRVHLKERHGLGLNIEPISLPIAPDFCRSGKIPTSFRLRFGFFLPDPLPGTRLRAAAYYDPTFTLSSLCLKEALIAREMTCDHSGALSNPSASTYNYK